MEKNQFNIPADRWKNIGEENQQNFNQVYTKVIEKKEGYLSGLPTDQRTQFYPLIDNILLDVVETCVLELHTA